MDGSAIQQDNRLKKCLQAMNWKPYLESIGRDSRYAISRQCYTPLDALDRRSGVQVEPPFLLDLRVRAVQESGKEAKQQEKEEKVEQQEKEEKVERLGVLEGLCRYAENHVLLAGRPGSGKTTALQRLLLEEAEKALCEVDTRIPVLLELRHYRESTLDLIKLALQEHGIFIDSQCLQELLQQGHLLLLADGINELPSEAARRELEAFRRGYRATTPMIFTTRELAAGSDLGIDKRLAMEPLTEPQMQQFVRAYLGEDGDKLLRQLQGRLRELAGVPLLLWMLCSLFQGAQERLPENLGLALRQFTSLYDHRIKGDAPVSEESRRWWPRLLQRLAFMMLQGPEPEELYVAISRPQAEDRLTEYLREEKIDPPRDRAMDWLKDLLNHHLLQRSASDSIEFRHQFIQEYYAAEYLLYNLPKLDDVTLQRNYLNYLKWTEPLILMLGLIEDRNQMRRVMKLAAEVDWKLAARLAGAVRLGFQQEAISFIGKLQIPEWHRVELYSLTRSIYAIPILDEALHHEDQRLHQVAVEALEKIGDGAAVSALHTALRDGDFEVCQIAVRALEKIGDGAAVSALQTALRSFYFKIRQAAARALVKIGDGAAVSALHTALRDADCEVRNVAASALIESGDAAAISALRTDLRDENFMVRFSAVLILEESDDAAAISALQTALGDEEFIVRLEAAKALVKIGNEAAVSALQTALRDENSKVRWNTAWALIEESGDAAAVSALQTALGDEDAEVRQAAVRAWNNRKSDNAAAVRALQTALGDEDAEVRRAAAEALRRIDNEAAVSALQTALGDEDAKVRQAAVWAWKKKISDAAAVSALHTALRDKDSRVRRAATEAMWRVGDDATAISALQTALGDEDSDVRRAAAKALMWIDNEAAVRVLQTALGDEDSDVRRAAVWAWERSGDATAVRVLQTALHDKDYYVRQDAASALGRRGDGAAVSALLAALRDQASEVRRAAAEAMWRVGDAAVGALQTALGDEDSDVRRAAVKVLGQMDDAAAVSALLDAMHDEHPNVRQAAVEALEKIGGTAAVGALQTALDDEDSWVRRTAVEALGEIGGALAVSALQMALRDDNYEVCQAAVKALKKIGGRATVRALHTALGNKDHYVRQVAAEVLGKIGDVTAASALLAVLRDDDYEVRQAAARALGEIGDTQLLAELAVDFRQGAQTNREALKVITSLQERFKVYRTGTFWSANPKTRLTGEKAMQLKVLRVILASPGDVQPERDVLPGVIEELNQGLGAVLKVDLKLYRWETDAYPGFHPEGPQGLIDPILRIDDCDVLIGIFWHRFGTPTKDAGSGTEHEFRTAYEAWKQNKRPQIMMYFKTAPYSPNREEIDQWSRVLDFKAAFPPEGLWWSFIKTDEFEDLVRKHLSGWLRNLQESQLAKVDSDAKESAGRNDDHGRLRAWRLGGSK